MATTKKTAPKAQKAVPSRHKSRHRAIQVLYQSDIRHIPVDDAIAAFYDTLYSEENEEKPPRDDFMEELARGAKSRTPDIDSRIQQHSDNWRLDRMPAVERNVLRLAIYELITGNTPAAVVIDEALDLSRRFAGDESVSFVNGVLDAIRKELQIK
jgi:N utilization substance protein B